jgi:hypothetical protein
MAGQYKTVRERRELSNYALRHLLGVSLRTAQRYEGGEAPVPKTVARLPLMYERHGIPKEWK